MAFTHHVSHSVAAHSLPAPAKNARPRATLPLSTMVDLLLPSKGCRERTAAPPSKLPSLGPCGPTALPSTSPAGSHLEGCRLKPPSSPWPSIPMQLWGHVVSPTTLLSSSASPHPHQKQGCRKSRSRPQTRIAMQRLFAMTHLFPLLLLPYGGVLCEGLSERMRRDSGGARLSRMLLAPAESRPSPARCVCAFDFDDTLRVKDGNGDDDAPAKEGPAVINACKVGGWVD